MDNQIPATTEKEQAISTRNMQKKNLISQWAFDTRPILGRFHLWLEDIRINWIHHNAGPV